MLQFYPENSAQMELVTTQAMKAGFYGGVVVDYPNSTKAKKFFLVLMTGGNMPLPKGLGTEGNSSCKFIFIEIRICNFSLKFAFNVSSFSSPLFSKLDNSLIAKSFT